MQLKKILYVVLVAIMMFSLAAFGIAAEGEEQTDAVAETTISATVSAENNIVKPGTSFNYALNITNNPGILNVDIIIKYNPEVLEFNEYTLGSVFTETEVRFVTVEKDTIRIVAMIDGRASADANGAIVTYNFTVLEGVDKDINDLVVETESTLFSILDPETFTDIDCTVVDCGTIKAHNYTSKVIDPTCTADGKTVYTCAGCNDVYEIVNEGSMIPHTPVAGEGKDATCTEEGLTPGSTCSECKAVLEEQEVIPMIDHNYVPGEAKNPTCTETGLTAGTYCSECGAVGEAQETVPAINHSFPGEWTTVKEPTVREEGKAERECLNGCGEKEVKSIDKLPAPPAPTMTTSPKEPWLKGTETGLQFVSSGDREYFTDVTVDGVKLTNGTDYVIGKDSTTVTLTATYLESLEAGEHTISIDSEFGSATAKFTVEEKSNTAIIVIIVVVAVVVVGVVATVVVLKKKELI